MDIITNQIRKVINRPEHQNLPLENKRVLVKDALIPYFLFFIYNHSRYRHLAFYGGTCARVVYNLNRFSEDIDLDNSAQTNLSVFKKELLKYINGVLQLQDASIHTQSGETGINRWTVKIPILYKLGLSPLEDEKIHLKIKISSHRQIKQLKKTPILRNGQSFVASHYDLPSLMAGKMVACLDRVFKKSETKIQVKGRDYYDLIWYMQRQILPLEEKLIAETDDHLDTKDAFLALQGKVKKISQNDLKADLIMFFDNRQFIESWIENFHDLFERYVEFYLKV